MRKIFIISFFLFLSLFIFCNSGYYYSIKSGDTLSCISKNENVPLQIIIHYNQELAFQKYLQINQKIYLPKENIIEYIIQRGDNLTNIARKYFTTVVALSDFNDISNKNSIRVGDILKIPYEIIGICFNQEQELGWPVIGFITSPYGPRTHPILGIERFHHGLDIASRLDTPIFSANSGIVKEVGYDSNGFGIYIKIKSNNKIYIYAHLNSVNIVPGVIVRKGDLIGKMGSTGLSTGPHLHFQIEDLKGNTYDPIQFLGNMSIAYNNNISDDYRYSMGGD